MLNWFGKNKQIPCVCPTCGCPASGGRGNYTFRYVNPPLIYFDVPKAASSSIRRAFFGKDESMSLRRPPLFTKELFRFSFVRNPYGRAVSNWKMFTSQPYRQTQFQSMGGKVEWNFLKFLDFSRDNLNHHWVPQTHYVPDDLDFLGKLETFEADFERVKSVALENGLIGETEDMPHLNQTNTKGTHFSEHYGPKERALVEQIYSEDLSRFGYDFETG